MLVLGLLTVLLFWQRGGLLGHDKDTTESGTRDIGGFNGVCFKPEREVLADPAFHRTGNIAHPFRPVQLGQRDPFTRPRHFHPAHAGLNILLGLAGVLDLGYAMSYAAGAYAAAILTSRFGAFDFTWVVLISAGTGALFGLLKGTLATRMRGDYLAVGTLALGLMTQDVIVNLDVTGGPNGFSSLPPPHLFGLTVASPSAQYYLVLFFVLIAALVSGRLIASRTGRAWIASSEDETAAVSFGIDASRYRLLAFIFSSALAGIAGALYASTFTYIDPSLAAFDISSLTLAMVILGGAGSVGGAVLGTALIYFYDKVFVPQLFAWITLLWPQGVYIGMVPNLRGTNFFDFGIVLYLTVLWSGEEKVAITTKMSLRGAAQRAGDVAI